MEIVGSRETRVSTRVCNGCDKEFRDDDLAPYQKNADGTYSEACRYCISEWIKLGVLWGHFPFWARKQELDRV